MIYRGWIARCDEPGCDAVVIDSHDPSERAEDKWDFGMQVNDEGWVAAPSRKACYCPEHADWETSYAALHERRPLGLMLCGEIAHALGSPCRFAAGHGGVHSDS